MHWIVGLLLGLSLQTSSLSAQQLTGRVIDQKSQEGIPYATLSLEGSSLGAICNEEGAFVLRLPDSLAPSLRLRISCLGYEGQTIPLSQLLASSPLSISLRPNPLSLPTVLILSTEYKARDLLEAALNQIDENFSDQPYMLHSFYRHYCIEDGVYGRLIEAAVDIYDRKGHKGPGRKLSKHTQLRVSQLRRSLDFTEFSYYNHLPIALNQTLEHDYTRVEAPFLNSLMRDQMSYSYVDTLTTDGHWVLVVRVSGMMQRTHVSTDFFIQLDNKAIIKTEEHLTFSYVGESTRVLNNRHYVMRYRQKGDSYYLSHLLNEGKRESWRLNGEGKAVDSDNHSHRISWMISDIKRQGFQPFVGKEPTADQLKAIPYNKEFWESYNVLASTPLENQIRRDLTARVALEKQFAGSEGLDQQYLEERAKRDFQQALSSHAGKAVLLCFWKSGNKPGARELLTLRKLNKKYSRLPFGLIWVNLDDSQEKMLQSIRKYGLYLGTHIYSPHAFESYVPSSYGIKESPYFVLLRPGGDIQFQSPKIPPYKLIMELAEKFGLDPEGS